MEIKEFAVKGTFEQLSEIKTLAEENGWTYLEEFTPFNEDNLYSLEEDGKSILYFCNKGVWHCGDYGEKVNSFSLTESITNDIEVIKGRVKTLCYLHDYYYKTEEDKLEQFLDFVVDKYTVEDGELINDENRVESKEEVISTFKTMYGQVRI